MTDQLWSPAVDGVAIGPQYVVGNVAEVGVLWSDEEGVCISLVCPRETPLKPHQVDELIEVLREATQIKPPLERQSHGK